MLEIQISMDFSSETIDDGYYLYIREFESIKIFLN